MRITIRSIWAQEASFVDGWTIGCDVLRGDVRKCKCREMRNVAVSDTLCEGGLLTLMPVKGVMV